MTGANTTSLAERLERSRAALLHALAERTEQDFARVLNPEDGETLGHALASLARAERADLATARSQEPPQRALPEKPLPPQVTHDLAGARYQTLTYLPDIEGESAERLIDAITNRESALASRIGTVLGLPTTE